ncbi:SDR family NAD(P)-dependent oxidoreductase [Caballeronia sp. 15715]|uniref:SDR family NAD(P)-dependent oxidoreductase n=1 Tax=unclassified Caballeronia TaxID=2646786 RepID=UPI0039E3DF40
MRNFKGKSAFVTGAASGIGFAIAEALGRQGMNVMLADIEAEALNAAVKNLRAKQINAEGIVTDVSRRNSVKDAAAETVRIFNKVHLVCNNAGAAPTGPLGSMKALDWDWAIDVNVKGVIFGMEEFVPLIQAHGEGGHIVNTASLAGLVGAPEVEAYSGTKHMVIGMSEGWASQLAPLKIGVSILLPGLVNTNIYTSVRNKTEAYGGDPSNDSTSKASEYIAELIAQGAIPDLEKQGLPASLVAEMMLQGHPRG